MPGRTKIVRGSAEGALGVLQANGLTFGQAVDLMNRAHDRRDKVVSEGNARLIFHSDGRYTAGPR